nr:putative ammonium transporter 2 [Dermacentor andersoni]
MRVKRNEALEGCSATFTADDATWTLTASIVIFTMQTGFGLLESGCVSRKNEVNILMKNVADVVVGGLGYWSFGYGLQFSSGGGSALFNGFGFFLVDAEPQDMGRTFTCFLFQLSFATTATTIVSGAMAERTSFTAYCLFSFLDTIVFCIPPGWLWASRGFLRQLGALDFAGAGCVHLLGGMSALVAAAYLGPRTGRYGSGPPPELGNPTSVLQGVFTLWWGWLVFNAGSTVGVTNNKWKYASRSAVSTINGSLGGALVGILLSYAIHRKFLVLNIVSGLLTGLVSVTGGSAYLGALDSVLVGSLGALLSSGVSPLLRRFRIDDPVDVVSVHGCGGAWGLLAIGLFMHDVADDDQDGQCSRCGLFKGGSAYLLAIQALTCVSIALWSTVTTYIMLVIVNWLVPIRMSLEHEVLGADLVEHGIVHPDIDYAQLLRSNGLEPSKLLPPRTADRLDREAWDLRLCRSYLAERLGGRGVQQREPNAFWSFFRRRQQVKQTLP